MSKVKLTANVLFSGIGCQELGIKNTNLFDLEVLNTSDIYKEAVVSYAAINCGLTKKMIESYAEYPSRQQMAQELTDINLGYVPEKDKSYDWLKLAKRKNNDLEKFWLANKLSNNVGDISRIKKLPYADLWTCSFPCTDISVAGRMKGLSPDDNTRSSLLWQQIRLLKTAKENRTLPRYLLFENVKNLVGKKFINDFNNLLQVLDDLGFNSYWKVLNAKECGIPQNRERVFVVCIRKDIDRGNFEFSKPFDSGIRLKDVLEKEVDEKYYLSDKVQNRLIITDDSLKNNVIETTKPDSSTIGQRDIVYNSNGIIGSLVATDYKQPKQIIDTNRCIRAGNLSGGKWDKMMDSNKRYYSEEGVSCTVTTCGGGNTEPKVQTNFLVRKLTPVECWKLMGLKKADCLKASSIGISSTHLYKQAGNGIVTDCVKLIFEHLYKAQYDEDYRCSDENFT